MTETPFDGAAVRYDAAFTDRPLGRRLRRAVRRRLDDAFRPGDRVLELGCGTGEDAVALARRGVYVHATDASTAMLAVAREKARRRGVDGHVACARLDLARLVDEPEPAGDPDAALRPPYDGAFSSFGALNCVADRRAVARLLARCVRPGGRVVLVVMGPFCPWEWVWYGLRGHVGTALRRFRSGAAARLGDGAAVRVWYPAPPRLRRDFAPWFVARAAEGVGVLLPPSFAAGWVERRPRLFALLARADAAAGAVFLGTWLNDHYMLVLERTTQEADHA